MGHGTDARLARRPEAIERRLGPEVLVVLGGERQVHRIAGPGALVWEALVDPATRAELVVRLRPHAPSGIDVVEVIRQGVEALLAASLVEVVSG